MFKKNYLQTRILSGTTYKKLSCNEVIGAVHADGGLVVLPHIGHQFDDSMQCIKANCRQWDAVLDYFCAIGLDGIELYWYRNDDTKDINELVAKEAARRRLRITYDSDYHGVGSQKDTMGLFWGILGVWR